MEEVENKKTKQQLITRLNRLEGQVRGVKQMILDERDCDAIVIQVLAIINSLKSFNNIVLKEHLSTKVIEDLKIGKEEAINEVITLFGRIN